MNNYIDERLIPYKRPQNTVNRYVRVEKGRPLSRRARRESVFVQALRFFASIFLLLLSTFGGEEESVGAVLGKAVKTCAAVGGVLLALWGILVLMSDLVNAATLLPTWSLILIFAAIVLVAAGVLKE